MNNLRLAAALLLTCGFASAQVTTIQGSDPINTSRTTINNNFSYLNNLIGSTVVQSNPNGTSCTTSTALAKIYSGTIYTCQSGTYVASGPPLNVTQTGTGAVSRPLSSKVLETVSVKDFGAVGDGSTDDKTAIDSAINSGAKTIMFPGGTYYYRNGNGGTQFSSLSNVKIFGQGGVTISFSNNGNSDGHTGGAGVGWQFDSATGLILSDLAFDYTTTPTTRTSCGTPLWVSNSNRVSLNNIVSLHSPCLAMYLQANSNLTANGLFAFNSLADGIHFEDTKYSTITNFVVDTTGDDCIAIHDFAATQYSNGAFMNGIARNCGAKGLSINGGKDITVTGLYLEHMHAQGVQIYADSLANGGTNIPDNIHISNAFIRDTGNTAGSGGDAGIDITQGLKVYLSDITVDTTNTTAGNPASGLRQNYFNSSVYALGYRIVNSGGEGVRVDAGIITHLSGIEVSGAAQQGITIGGGDDILIENAIIKNVCKTGGLNRAVDMENLTGNVVVRNVDIRDNQSTPTGYQVFTFNITGVGTINGITGRIDNGNLSFGTSGTDNTRKHNFFSNGFTQPGCSASTRALDWNVLGATGVADVYQVCQKNSSDVYAWVTK